VKMDDLYRCDDPESATLGVASRIHQPGQIGLSLLGPFSDGASCVAVHAVDGQELTRCSPRSTGSDLGKHWMVVFALDCVRRVLLGNLHSPVD